MKDGVGIIEKGAKAIKKEAFLNNKDITSIVIPDSVTEIGESAFAGCSNLHGLDEHNNPRLGNRN